MLDGRDFGERGADGGRACGAFSAALQAVLAAHQAPKSNWEVVRHAREVFSEQGSSSTPASTAAMPMLTLFVGQQETKAKSN